MTDVDAVADEIEARAEAPAKKLIRIPVPKGAKGEFVEIDPDLLPQEVYEEIFKLGCKALVGRGMTKVTKDLVPNEAQRYAEAKRIAEENVTKMYEGKVRMTTKASSASKLSRELKTEAMRLARAAVKEAIKDAGGKISHYSAKQVTELATDLLESNPEILAEAEANLKERAKVQAKVKIDLKAIPVDPKKVAASEAKAKAKAKPAAEGQLSAKQAGKTKARSQAPAHAHQA